MNDIFTERFREALKSCGLSQTQIADKVNITKQCLPGANLTRTHLAGKITVYARKSPLIVLPSTISRRFARLSS